MTKQKVLIPVDGSEFSQAIFPALRQFFKPEDVELILLRVTDVPSLEAESLPPSGGQIMADLTLHRLTPDKYAPAYRRFETRSYHLQEALRHQYTEELQAVARPLVEAGYEVGYAVDFGDPARHITEFAHNERVDLIAMATHGHSGLRRLLLGSVARAVLHDASIPVLLLRPFVDASKKVVREMDLAQKIVDRVRV